MTEEITVTDEVGSETMNQIQRAIMLVKNFDVQSLVEANKIFEDAMDTLLTMDCQVIQYKGYLKAFQMIFSNKVPLDVLHPMEDFLKENYKLESIVNDTVRARVLIYVLSFLINNFVDMRKFPDMKDGESETVDIFNTFIDEIVYNDHIVDPRCFLLNRNLTVKRVKTLRRSRQIVLLINLTGFGFETKLFECLNCTFKLTVNQDIDDLTRWLIG
nr:p25 [chieh-qua chlorotic virus]